MTQYQLRAQAQIEPILCVLGNYVLAKWVSETSKYSTMLVVYRISGALVKLFLLALLVDSSRINIPISARWNCRTICTVLN